MADDNAPQESQEDPAPSEEVPETNDAPIEALGTERDKLNQQAGSDDKLPVNEDGDKDKDAQSEDSRALIKERAKALREQKEAAKDQQKAAKEQQKTSKAQLGSAEQNKLVKVREGAFGEVKTFKPRYKADADGDTYDEITPASRFKKWVKRN